MKLGLKGWWPDKWEHTPRYGATGIDTARIESFNSWQYVTVNGTDNWQKLLDYNWAIPNRISILHAGYWPSHEARLAFVADADYIRRFVEWAVKMDALSKGRVTGWQVLNEPSPGNLSLPGYANSYPAMFDFIVQITAALRAALPKAWLTGPAWCNVLYGGETDGLVSRNYLDLVDAYDCHDYNLVNGDPTVPQPHPGGIHPSQLERYRLVRSKIGTKPMTLTEFGLNTAATPEHHALVAQVHRECGIELAIFHDGEYATDLGGFNIDGSMRESLRAYLDVIRPTHSCPTAPARVNITVAELDSISGIGAKLAGRTKIALDGWGYTREAT